MQNNAIEKNGENAREMLITFQNSRNVRDKKDTKNILLPIEEAVTEQGSIKNALPKFISSSQSLHDKELNLSLKTYLQGVEVSLPLLLLVILFHVPHQNSSSELDWLDESLSAAC